MPIVQLQSEFAAALSIAPPEYTWATKPSAAGNSGKRITITGWMAPPSDWVSDGTYWLPVDGRAVVHAPELVNALAQQAAFLPVASVPGWQMPADMASTPRLYIEAMVTAEVTASAGNTQQRLIYVGVQARQDILGVHVFTSTTTGKRFWGKTYRNSSPAEWMAFTGNAQPFVDTNSITARATDAEMSATPIQIRYQGGASDGSEIIKFHSFGLAVGLGV